MGPLTANLTEVDFNSINILLTQLSTTFVDATTERQRAEDEAEPMDWDSVDPGLMRELLDCRKKSAAFKGPMDAEEILAKVVGCRIMSGNFPRSRF